MDIGQYIKAEARNLGFSLAGITSLAEPDHLRIYQEWLAGSRHGGMAYLAREDALMKRKNPGLLMKDAASILCLAFAYPNPAELLAVPGELTGKVAAYAWLPDYHDILPPLAEELVRRIEVRLGCSISHRVFTDSAPILERDLAWRAGLGWIGKNGCLIHADAGSCFFLVEVMLDLELPLDQPFTADRCGSCTRCIDACPTQCILPNRTIDARRCISYLTIEHKGSIPREMRDAVGSWIFGCDACQSACPWNQRLAGQPRRLSDTGYAVQALQPNLIGELLLTSAEFAGRYGNSALQRARYAGYLRNVALALGNSRSMSAVPALTARLKGEASPIVREACAWALGQIGGEDARSALRQCLEVEPDPMVRCEIQLSLPGNDAGRV